MYCPNCGVEIHTEGSFCAKCRKNIAYLTKTEDEPAPTADENIENSASASENSAEAEIDAQASLAPITPPSDKPAEKGFYCNHCGTFVYPEDHFCYDCGKKTRPAYYKTKESGKKMYAMIAALMIIIAIISYAVFF